MSISILTRWRKAFTTDSDGNDALRTVISGDQDLGGGYILDDQTTTNMMSKGTVFHFDGVDDEIPTGAAISGLADFTIISKFSLEEAPSSGILYGNNASNHLMMVDASTIRLVASGETDNITLDSALANDTEYDFAMTRISNIVSIYINGVVNSTTATNSGSASFAHIGSRSGAAFWGAGSLAKIGLLNFGATAAEVKDLISGNIPFKWQYGSQTELVTNGDMEAGLATFDGNALLTQGGAIAQDAGQKHGGANSALWTGDDSNANAYSYWRGTTDGFEAGVEYYVEAWVYLPAGGSEITSLDLFVGAQLDTTALTDQWVKLSGYFIGSVNWVIIGKGAVGITTDTYYIDDVSIRRVGTVALYTQDSITANNWFDLANGNTGAVTGAEVLNPKGISTDEDNIPNFSVTSGITADTGSAQGNGVLTASINQISVCGNAGDAVTLPAAKPGKVIWVFNDGANASDVFPASGDNIDEAGANAALSVAVNAEVQFVCTSAGHWSAIVSA